ncbi:MAG: endonuclease/exonuclease/phosphatase family protein [Flavisolibacter sp.]
MQAKNKRWKLFFLVVYIGIVFVYLLTCLIPFLDPGTFWFIALLGLGFPFLLSALLIVLIIAALARSRWSFLALAVLLLSWQQVTALFGFHTRKEFELVKHPTALRVFSWNVSSWTENNNSTDRVEAVGLRNLMMDAVQMENADVLCFQEFFESYAAELYPPNIPVLQKMGFNYYYFTPSLTMMNGGLKGGLCVFSKYPISDTAFHKTDKGNSEGYSVMDINVNGQNIRLFNTHLESPRLTRGEYSALDEVEESRTVGGKIKRAYALRSRQARELRAAIDTSRYPIILCGDFNDVPNSYSYFEIKGNLQDAFLKKGFALGRTFQFISPTLRIDYMLVDKRFTIEQFTKLNYRYSDHYPQVMDVSLSAQ